MEFIIALPGSEKSPAPGEIVSEDVLRGVTGGSVCCSFQLRYDARRKLANA